MRSKARCRIVVQVRCQPEIAAIGGVRMQPEAILLPQIQNLRAADRLHPPPSFPALRRQFPLRPIASAASRCVQVHPSVFIAGNRRERQPQHRGDALVRVVGLLRRHNLLPRHHLPGNPQRFQVCERAAAGQVADEFGLQPNMAAISRTASHSMRELARPPSRAWLLGLSHITMA